MYDTAWDDKLDLPDGPGHDPALAHRGDLRRVLTWHEEQVALAASRQGVRGLRALGPLLMGRIADARTLFVAAQHLQRGHKAPGPDGRRLELLTTSELWSLCRALGEEIREGHYRPGPGKTVPIPKLGKSGFRQITLQNARDKVVARAIMLILQPMYQRLFSPFSFGFRPRVGRMEALASALAISETQHRWVWVSADIANAFDRIPLGRLLSVCGLMLPADVVGFIGLVANKGTRRGIRQGSSLSPLLANVYFHHTVDRPWHREASSSVMLRYADDLLVPCRDADEAAAVHQRLVSLAINSGTPLKSAESPIVALDAGRCASVLGFKVRRHEGQVSIGIGKRAWQSLAAKLARAHLRPGAPLRARSIIKGWIGQMGPCYMDEDRPATLDRIREVAADQAFDEIPATPELDGFWQRGYARWKKLEADQRQQLASRREAVRKGIVMTRTTPSSQGDTNHA